LEQYYRHERAIAANSLNTGRVMAKIGINSRRERPKKDEHLTFFIVDRKPHLTQSGVKYLAQWVGKLFIVTDNPGHPAFDLRSLHKNIQVIFYKEKVDFPDLFVRIRQEYGVEHLVIESGGTMNSVLVRQGLIDHVCIIVAPLLVGGSATSTLMDGTSLRMEQELVNLKALKLVQCSVLEHSYLRLEYDVINETVVDPEIE